MPVCEPYDIDALRDAIDLEQAKLEADDLVGARDVERDMATQIPCLTDVPRPNEWAPHLVIVAIVSYSQNGDWQTPMSSALAADPTVPRLVGDQHPIAQWRMVAVPGESRAIPAGVQVWLDGRTVASLPPLVGPHLLQTKKDGELASIYVDGDGTTGAWDQVLPRTNPGVSNVVAPVEPKGKAHPVWIGAGAGVAGVGLAIAGGSFAAAHAPADEPGAIGSLRALNGVGWVMAAAGAGLAVSGAMRVDAGPQSITLTGKF